MDKYTDKYINNFNILNNAVIGFEFEYYCEISLYKQLELLNRELSPITIKPYRVYHSSFEPTENVWKIEPDLSGGFDMVELVTGPLPYVNAKIYLLKVLKILQRPEFKTDDKCSIHVNISFDKDKTTKVLDKLNKLKLILNVDENFVYKYFPDRENNFYAKTVKKLIPFKSYDFSNNAAELLVNSLELPDTKYYGINLLNIFDGRVEYRYIGGVDYEKKSAEIIDLVDYFVELTWNCIDNPLDEDDMEELEDYLSDNINQFKNFTKLDNFIAEFPSIDLQVDLNPDLLILRTYYEQMYDDIYDIITNIYNLNNCIINYNTENQRLELVNANFKTIFDIKRLDIIDSVIDGGTFVNCNIVNCDIKNAHLSNCTIIYTDVYNSKLESSKIHEGTILNDSYVFNCLLDGLMKGGIFRSGKVGENGELDSKVKIVTSGNNYFGDDKDQSMEDKLKSIGSFKNKSNTDKKKWFNGYNTTKSGQIPGEETTF